MHIANDDIQEISDEEDLVEEAMADSNEDKQIQVILAIYSDDFSDDDLVEEEERVLRKVMT